ncbi:MULTISPECIES: hypothetical protein [Microbacterium]|uniref:hypothetical protein n=1 Tax=Microbacterium TaxID=33882 RepID=UPI0027859522|nr:MULTISPECIES: hypothetical protein [Microbacterium]MDQ1082761.1 hypothetical protein [Microbacterium sp. SORGH_AS_0344]MDQ1168469.1 hypothetical protein [Microbacterium proteolyticum]
MASSCASGIGVDADESVANRRLGIRHARAMTLDQPADAMALPHPFLSRLERGPALPSLSW